MLRFTVLFVAQCILFVPGGLQAQQLPSLDVIEKAVTFYADSISTLEGKFEHRVISRGKSPGGPDVIKMEDRINETTFLADVVHGWRKLDETGSWLYSWYSTDQKFVDRSVQYFDGNKACALTHHFLESPVDVEIPAGAPMFLNMQPHDLTDPVFGPWFFSALQLRGLSGRGLASLFQEKVVTLDGEEEIDGARCVRITGRIQGRIYQFWLDPDRDYLPRKQVFGPESKEYEQQMLVKGFKQFDDGSGNLRWFPTSGVAITDFSQHPYELLELKLNPVLTQDQFMINPETLPPGVQVHEMDGKKWVVGGRQDLFEQLEKQRDKQDEMMEERLHKARGAIVTSKKGEPEVVRVTEETFPWIQIAMFCAGAILIGIGVRTWFAHRRNVHDVR
ncbi:MAG: hypothetical protein DWI22_08795 [Planctomycetota bacterium]|nr:MAG: hypothetical protein DWI22_08795 [Planctomycetota bacterium]